MSNKKSASTFRFLVNFKDPGQWLDGNDLLPASVTEQEDGRVYVHWDNGWYCTIDRSHLNFKLAMEETLVSLKEIEYKGGIA